MTMIDRCPKSEIEDEKVLLYFSMLSITGAGVLPGQITCDEQVLSVYNRSGIKNSLPIKPTPLEVSFNC